VSVADPAIITCSISGSIANRAQCPAIPYTPSEYAAEARRIVDEGGVHIHIHARKPDGTPSYEIEDFQAIRDAIRAEIGHQAIINFSTGAVGVPIAKRIAYLEACRPEVAALNMGSLNYAKYSRSRRDFVFKFVFVNPFEEIIELLGAMGRLHIKPEHECFDLGHVGSLHPLLDMGLLQPPLHADFVMGVVGGVPASARNLAAMAGNLSEIPFGEPSVRPAGTIPFGEPSLRPAGTNPGPQHHHWSVIGIGRDQWMMVAAALTLGGSIRVGLEDNFYLPSGEMARSNGELIAKARQMTEEVGRRPATVQEARDRLAIGLDPPVAGDGLSAAAPATDGRSA
jgi:3-keto-5-aminohexanoate cleavage enzyme